MNLAADAANKASGTIMSPHHKVKILKDTTLPFPELYLDVYVEGPECEAKHFPWMLARGRCKKADKPEEADLVIFSGGDDVNPALYNETQHLTTHYSTARDDDNIKLYEKCIRDGIPMVGVCRGAQFLHVMNGGKLFQHIDNHHGDHSIWDTDEKRHINKISSVHHQAVRPNANPDFEILAQGGTTNTRWLNMHDKEEGRTECIEAYFYRSTCCLGFQGHPEYQGFPLYTQWCLKKINRFICENPDIELRGRYRRLNEAVMKQSKEKAEKAEEEAKTKEQEADERFSKALGYSVH